MKVRNASLQDLPAIVAMYNAYIADGFNGIFREKPVTVEERTPWLEQFKNIGPHQVLVVTENGSILRMACSFEYRGGGVFHRTVETSIYTDPNKKAKGIGTMLYTELFRRIEQTGLHLAVVGIALPNDASIALHRKFGFEDVGTFKEYAFFRGQYVSSLWMQKILGT
jgi:phosphinothricin acetyltransferase